MSQAQSKMDCTYLPIQAAYRPMWQMSIGDGQQQGNSVGAPCLLPLIDDATTPGNHEPFCVPTFDDDNPDEYDEDWTCCEWDDALEQWECSEVKEEDLPPGYHDNAPLGFVLGAGG